ncbi:kinase domain-containing protein [Alternaria alternata]|jgi:serine/threonine protein kinase|uniref:Kinase domain-containing protein n=1 Tax=Alternaria alternata TaxID=5599 RepID=A0A177E1L4_ALTAL|nr:kinase domain-containing protein [Alternaria alternata]OAG25628.1 kinase domain-containing protein [Alternaria alternata]
MSARTLTNVVNDQTVALNALIYGYAGHSLVTPQHALQQIWWTEERINEKVNHEYVTSRLQPKERERLTQPVGFGDLSDDTYIEWILEKARRLFLILVEIGEADRIFAVVDRSWDDDDLPLEMDDIEQLSLSNRRDNHANARFYHTQFTFLLRELREGIHIDYAPNEEIPVENVMSLPVAVSLQAWSRMHLPKKPKDIFVRRRFALGDAETPDAFEQDFMMDVESARMVEHEHFAPIWASYTAKGVGYIVTNFVGHHTLRTFIDHRNPTQYQKLPKPDRRWLVLNWMHCLADAIATLHQNGFCHSAIRPSNILVDEQNAIAFSDIGSLETFQKDKKPDAMDAYIYSAPEANNSAGPFDPNGPAPSPVVPSTRHASIMSKSSSGSSSSSGSQRQKLTKAPTTDFSGFNFGFKKSKQKPVPKKRSRVHESETADIFSLGCVFLEIITFMLKKKPHDFVKHRTSKQRTNTGGKNSRTDSSYHVNLDKVETWINLLEKASFEHDDDAFRAVPHILQIIRSMLSRAPTVRPAARDVRDKIFDILFNYTSIPDIHCGAHKHDVGIATSSYSGSDRASLMTMSTMSSMSSSTSDTDTIRSSTTRVSSILNSYSDRTTLHGIEEDDSSSIKTLEPIIAPGHVGKSYESPREAPMPPGSPTSPISPRSPTSPSFARPSSPLRPTSSRGKSWSKPFMLLP